MTRSERMKPVRRVTASREQDAARAFEEANRAHQKENDQLAALQQYREEYRAQMLQTGAGGISAARLNQFRGFLAQLDEAIKQQERAVAQAAAECERRRRLWLDARARTQIMDKVVSRYQDEEARLEERAAQKLVDELAQRHGRNGPGSSGE